jgi:hypothetical protein
MTINVALFIGICTVTALLLYISIIQYRRAEKALQFGETLLDNMGVIKKYIREATEKMNNPQLKQAFESDDEIGFFFQELQSIQETLTTFLPDNEETITDIE